MRREAVICLALAALTLGVYWPVGNYPFVAYDDLEYVADNPHVKAGLTWEGDTLGLFLFSTKLCIVGAMDALKIITSLFSGSLSAGAACISQETCSSNG